MKRRVRVRTSLCRALRAAVLAGVATSCATHGAPPRVAPSPSAPTPREAELPSVASASPIRVQIADHGSRRVVTLDIDDYVVGCVMAEIGVYGLPPAVAERVLEMQALLCRTNAVANRGRHAQDGFDLCSGSHCQIYRVPDNDAMTKLARRAVASTRGQIVMHEGKPIQAIFHADCAGHTSAPETVWGGSEPYLRARADDFCLRLHTPAWTFTPDRDRLREALNRNPNTRVGHDLRDVRVVARDEAGRASRIELRGEGSVVVRGAAFRWALLQAFGARSLKSTHFTVRRQGGSFVFQGEGNGHGVGLCQLGALARARDGHSAETILRFYYPGIQIAS
ncbi:MAG: SpoIID/LytB domain-containing protein [Acidobacteria bacterium]|nr:SpoIID/LytB domain-containing protein [Acidobacteriota bacterium]MBI3262772.1 SpoIID/LytB domain-containing protein [Acidobacteriota bacterium]